MGLRQRSLVVVEKNSRRFLERCRESRIRSVDKGNCTKGNRIRSVDNSQLFVRVPRADGLSATGLWICWRLGCVLLANGFFFHMR